MLHLVDVISSGVYIPLVDGLNVRGTSFPSARSNYAATSTKYSATQSRGSSFGSRLLETEA